MKHWLLCLPLLLAGCLTGQPSPFSTGARIGSSWVYWDGDVLVARGDVGIEAGVWLKDSGLPVVGPVNVPQGSVLVARKSDGFQQLFTLDAPIPYWAVFAFPGGATKAQSLGVTFTPPQP